MTLFAFEHLLISVLCLSLAIFINKHAQTKTHQAWAYFNISVTLWSSGSLGAGLAPNPELASIFLRISLCLGILTGPVFYNFVCTYCKIRRNLITKIAFWQAIICAPFALFSNGFINSIVLLGDTYCYRGGWVFYIWFHIWIIVVTLGLYELIKYMRSTKRIHRTQTHFVFWSLLIGFIGGGASNLSAYGIDFYPSSQISVIFYAFIMTYAIFKHELLPISIVIKKGILYSLLATFVSLTYLVAVIASQKMFDQYLGFSSTIITSIIIAITFTPLKDKFQLSIDKLFLKASPLEIAQENELLKQEVSQTEKFKAVANLASGIAHEIKNPLTVLQTFSEYLPSKKDDPDFIKTYQTLIPKEITRINQLVQDLLAFAKPSQPQFENIDPHKIIKEVISLTCIQSKNIHVETLLEPKPVTLQADPQQLKQALLNIVMNAIDAMPNGGTLTIKTTLENSTYTITISDTGHGIDPKDLPYIFEPFYSKKEKGTGLGLSITKDIIEKHDGKIRAESKLKQGTIFRILLK